MASELLLKSRAWRTVVALGKASPTFFAGFSACVLVGSYALGGLAMAGSNPEGDSRKEDRLRRRGGLDHQVMAKVNKERLQVLLDEVKERRGGSERYAKALNGESMGTHTSGTTVGAQGIGRKA
mmetsp:Transcript_8363/g.23581  ORF Transcript_8363/g.23581 Transcript_8363/m.23581 type:complete len:124 (+) Transcript_8363:81-452(+)